MKRTISLLIVVLMFTLFANAQKAGSVDESFGIKGKVISEFKNYISEIRAILVQKDKKIIAVGNAFINKNAVAVTRYNENGKLDSNFGVSGQRIFYPKDFFSRASCATLQDDGKIIVGGGSGIDFRPGNFYLIRFLADGTLDTSFGNKGEILTGNTNYVQAFYSITTQSDNKIVATGYSNSTIYGYTTGITMRFLPNGKIDSAFGNHGTIVLDNKFKNTRSLSIVVQPDNKILIGGYAQEYSNDYVCQVMLARYNKDGSPDISFGNYGLVLTTFNRKYEYLYTNEIALQKDNKIVLSATYLSSEIGANQVAEVIRFKPNGNPDSSFGINGELITNFGGKYGYENTCLALQADEKIIIGGIYTKYNVYAADDFAVARLNKNGSVDSTFGNDGRKVVDIKEGYDYTYDLAIQYDGKILLAGTSCDSGSNRNNDFSILRLNGDKINNSSVIKNESQININNRLLIYPNPVRNILNIKGLSSNKQAVLSITDMSGRLMKRIEVKYINGYDWNVSDIPSGVYLLNVKNDYKIDYIKFKKE